MKSAWAACIALVFCSDLVAASEFRLEVSAGNRDLKNVLVVAPGRPGLPREGQLEPLNGASGSTSFQTDPEGNVAFLIHELPRGESGVFRLKQGDQPDQARAELKQGRINLSAGGRDVLVYHRHETELPRPEIRPIFKRGGYIHPVFSPSGRPITDDYPPNHVHHHGIWSPWTKTVFEGRSPDFWNMGDGKGKVEFAGFGENWSGPVHAGFTTAHRFIDLTAGEPKTVLNETWKVTSFSVPGADYFLFDLVLTQTCATASRLELPKYHYGGLGVRGNWNWNGAGKALFLTSNGETNRIKGNETRGEWCYMGGEVNGIITGVAIFCHPDNFRAPQGMRLHPSEPFFCYAPSQGGDWAIEPGRPYVARYRFVVKDGPPDKTELQKLWEDYANPPSVRFTVVND